MTAGRRRPLVGLVLASLCACNDPACVWTDDPNPDPWRAHELERRYPTADGAFEIELFADGTWPPVVGAHSLRIGWVATDGTSAGGEASAARPFSRDGAIVADDEPTAVEVEPMLWRIEDVMLDVPGQWVLPIIIAQGGIDDSIELHIDVIEPAD